MKIELTAYELSRIYDALCSAVSKSGDNILRPIIRKIGDALDNDIADQLDGDIETREHYPDCPATDGFGCRCTEIAIMRASHNR